MFLTADKLPRAFKDKLATARRIDIASAWATFGPGLDLLCAAHKKRGKKIRAIIGTFGNATDPDALERLQEIGKLCLVDGGGPLFHPKIYIFRNGRTSSVWIGSANFTRAGFGRNEEVVYETGDCEEALKWFEKQWEDHGGRSPVSKIDEYRKRRKRQGVSRTAAKLAGQPEQGLMSRTELLVNASSWQEYLAALGQCNELWMAEGVKWTVLGNEYSYVHTIDKGKHVAHRKSWVGLDDQERAILLGLRDDVEGAWGLLGTLTRATEVKAVFATSNEAQNRESLKCVREIIERVIMAPDRKFPDIAEKALTQIRDEGGFGFGVGTATRLLTLARPDRMVSVNSKSRVGLAEAFGLAPSTLGKNYGQLLENLYTAPWYRDPPGLAKRGLQLWNMRAALVDSFVYDPR